MRIHPRIQSQNRPSFLSGFASQRFNASISFHATRANTCAFSISARCFRPISIRRVMTNAAGSTTRTPSSQVQMVSGRRVLRDTSRVCFLVDRIEAKLPHPIETPHISHIQYECATGFNRSHGISSAARKRNFVAYGQVLKLQKNAVRTRAIQKAEEPVEPVVAVQTAALIPHLHQPRPNVFRPRIDGYSHRVRKRWLDDEAVAHHHLVRSDDAVPQRPIQRRSENQYSWASRRTTTSVTSIAYTSWTSFRAERGTPL